MRRVDVVAGVCGRPLFRLSLAASVLLAGLLSMASAATPVPDYEECRLEAVFPAGGQRGQTVVVELRGNKGGLQDAREIVIDGPPGVTAQDLTNIDANQTRATLLIAADAIPGRRSLRVRSDRSGLTNMLYFSVGRLPEVVEQEPNNLPVDAPLVPTPTVINGRLDPAADIDVFRFEAVAGQAVAAIVAAQAIDSHGQYKDYGFVDADLQILDADGRILAESLDAVGLDPALEWIAPAAGTYLVKVQHVLYRGFPQAVYRLTLGSLAVPTSVFPPGGPRGETVDVEFDGLNFGDRLRQSIHVPQDELFPQQWLSPDAAATADCDLPFLRGAGAERVESEPNDPPAQATPVAAGQTINGRFLEPGDVDHFRVRLSAGQAVSVETVAHRFLRSPADTHLAVLDGEGKLLAENDDGFAIDYMSVHDFQSTDSRLTFTPAVEGDYTIRVSDRSGGAGPRWVYRMSAAPAVPDFRLETFPDGVPIWGPGTTAAVLVRIERLHGLTGDIRLTVEGLPDGWTGSAVTVLAQTPERPASSFYAHYGARAFLTITAPADAAVGDMTPFHIVGRTEHEGRVIERVAQPMTLYYSSDIGFFRITPVARAAIAAPRGPWLTPLVERLSGKPGQTLEVPVAIHGVEGETDIELVANLATAGVACSLAPPATVPIQQGRATFLLTLPDTLPPGKFGITVARRWRSDIRVGMPGPCTPLIPLVVETRDPMHHDQ